MEPLETQIWKDDIIEQICIAQILRNSQTVSGRRLALIIIDNAVEYMLKAYGDTFLVSQGIVKIDEWEEKKRSFKKLTDCIAANSNLKNLSDVFNYHKLRNTLYHEAAPLSVESIKVTEYINKAKGILRELFNINLSEEEWCRKVKRTILALQVEEKRGLVAFLPTDDGLVKMQTEVNLKDTEAILLMIYGFSMVKGKAPDNIDELTKCLNYSGHPVEKEKLMVKISKLRKAKMITKGKLILRAEARDKIKSRYFTSA